MTNLTIIDYQPEFKNAFKELNYHWINKFFKVEENDIKYLENPEKLIIHKGGYIFFASIDKQIVGTVALILNKEKNFELAKMAVDENFQNQGIGKILIQHCLNHGKKIKASSIFLESNTLLTPAISLYKKMGFVEIPIEPSCYSRCNIRMQYIYH